MRRYPVLAVVLAIFFFASVFVGATSGLSDTQTLNQIEDESNNDSTESLIVRFEPYSGGVGTQSIDTDRPDVEDLKRHADNSQADFKERFGSNSKNSTTAYTDRSAVTIKQEFWIASAALVEIDTNKVSRSKLLDTPGVERVHENFEVSITETAASRDNLVETRAMSISPQTSSPNTLKSTTLGDNPTRAIEHINAPDVWNTYDNRGGGVRVAVVDTGVNPNHPDIDIPNKSDRWVCYVDCSGNPDGPHDVDGHGTHVSGTIVGGGANDKAIDIGVAPNATLMHAKGLGDDGSGSFASVANSMQWAVENNADILSLSLGANGKFDQYIEPVRNAQTAENGTIVIAASGNSGPDPTSSSPGNVYGATAVGSTDLEPEYGRFGVTDNHISGFSNGEIVYKSDWDSPPTDWPDQYVVPDVVAPGSPIWSADANISTKTHGDSGFETEDLTYKSGTSMATPHVAGVAALMQAETNSQLTPGEVNSALRLTANTSVITDPDRDDETRKGEGLINAVAAVEEVQQPPFFDVEINDINNTVTEGENITVNYTVENTGDIQDTQDIEFRVNGSVETTRSNVTLTSGSSDSNSFTYTTQTGDAPAAKLNVSTSNSSAEQIVTVQQPPFFQVTIDDINESVAEGENITVNYTVENTGDIQDTQDIEFRVNGSVETTRSDVTLAPGSSDSNSFTYTTQTGDAPAAKLNVSTSNSSAEQIVIVQQPPFFQVTIDDFDSKVTEGENITVNYTIKNTGDIQDTQNIVFRVNGSTEATETGISLSSQKNFSGSFIYTSKNGDAPAVELNVSSADTTTTQTTIVREPPFFDITIDDVDSTVAEGETITIDYTVKNTGGTTATQPIKLTVGELGTNSTQKTLNSGAITQETLSISTSDGDAGDYTAVVSSEDDSDSTDVAVTKPQYSIEFNGPDIYAFGSPIPTDQTLTEAFDENLTGFNGSIYIFNQSDGSWTHVSSVDGEVEINALEAYVVVVNNGSASATIRLAQTELPQPASFNLTEGFNFITPTQQEQAGSTDTPAFRTTQDTFSVLNPFAQPSVSPGDEDDFSMIQTPSDDPSQVNPFAGYFVSASGGLALSDVNTEYNQTQADSALNVTS